MALVAMLCLLPLLAVAIGSWAWRFHMHALLVLGPSLAVAAGVPGMVTGAEVDLVLVDDDSVLVGVRPQPGVACRSTSSDVHTPMVLSLSGQDDEALPRLLGWQASRAPVLVWRDHTAATVEMVELLTGRCLSLRDITSRSEAVRECASRHPSNGSGRPGGTPTG
jgi:hypothetical protein